MTRALLQQALDALETVSAIDMWAGVIPHTNDRIDDAKYKATKAIEALRAELVKPEQPVQEPLTDIKVSLLAHNEDPGDWNTLHCRGCWFKGFLRGVKVAEEEHGIVGKA